MQGFTCSLTVLQNQCFNQTPSPACYISLWTVIKNKKSTPNIGKFRFSLIVDFYFSVLHFILCWNDKKQARIKIQASGGKFWCLFLCPFRGHLLEASGMFLSFGLFLFTRAWSHKWLWSVPGYLLWLFENKICFI